MGVEEREDEVKHEHAGKVKAEQAYKKLEKEYNDITKRLDESGGATHAQYELYKKREVEWTNIKRDIEQSVIHHEAFIASFRKKHKDKATLYADAEMYKGQMDALAHDKAAAEKVFKKVYDDIADLTVKWDEQQRCISDYDVVKKKYAVENAELLKQYEESHAAYNQMYKITQTLGKNLEEIKKFAYDDNKDRHALLAKYKNLEHDWDHLHEQYNEEYDAKWELERNLKRAQDDAALYRAKYETEGIQKSEEMEAARLKVNARLEEAEQQIEQLNFKYHALEKVKARISYDYDQLYKDHEADYVLLNNLEKKQYNFEHIIGEWKVKIDDLTRDVSNSQLATREVSGELFKAKNLYDESLEHLDVVRKENKALSDEIKDLMDQICEGGRNLHDMSKNVKKYEIEKEELAAALYEAEIALENEENKVLKDQLEYSKVKQEIDQRIHQKEEEFDAYRKVQQKAYENMQEAYENEAKAKAEAQRQWAKYKADIHELEISYDHTQKTYADLSKTVKKVQLEIKEMQDKYMEEHNLASEYREQFSVAERRGNALYGELEESR